MIARIRNLVVTAVCGTIMLVPTAALAGDDQATFRISAVVKPFCQITVESGDDSAVLTNGEAHFGAVRELCNTHSGYSVRAEFFNLQSGSLRAGTDVMRIASDGAVVFGSNAPQFRIRNWSVFDVTEQADQRIYMRVSISPF